MKKLIILGITLLIFTTSAHAEDFTQTVNKFCKNLFNKTQTTENSTEQNFDEEKTSLSADAMILYNANDIEGSLQILESIPEEKRTALDWLLIGNIYQDKKDIDKTATCYQKAITTDAKFYRGYYNLANLYLDDENSLEAIKLYKLSIKYKHDFSYAYYNMGCAYVKLGDLKKAKSSFLKAIEHKNDLVDAYYNLAFVYKELNDTKKAEEYLKIYNELITRKL